MWSRCRRWSPWGLLALLLVVAPPSGAGPPTHGAVGRILLDDLLTPLLAEIQGAGLSGVALRAEGKQEALQEAMAIWFHDHGLEVWEPQEGVDLPPEVALLEFRPEELSLELPQAQEEFLGLGPDRIHRRAVISLSGRLSVPATGRWLWRGSPEARYEDWVTAGDLETLESDLPGWMPRPGRLGEAKRETPWYERLTVVALLGGVALLYFSGAN